METVQILWAIGNVVLIWVFSACIVFAVIYPILFDQNSTSAGKAVWQVGLSLAGLATVVVIGIFIDNPRDWWVPAEGTDLWRVVLRLIIYGLVGYAMTNLVVVIILRKFWPTKVKTAPPGEDTMDIRPRRRRAL